MISSSRILPPGWIAQLAPPFTTTSKPSRKGKKASLATAEPLRLRPAFSALILAMRAESTRLIWPAPIPSVIPLAQYTIALDFTNFATRHANIMSCISLGVGSRLLTTRISFSSTFFASGDCTSKPPPTRLKSKVLNAVPRGISKRRTFCLAAKMDFASSLKLGAINTSTNCLEIASAAVPSQGTLKAMIPPKAELGSVLNAFW